MPTSRSLPTRIVVIAEADADRQMVCGLIDRKITHHAPDCFDRDHATEQLDALREWRGLEPRSNFTRWNRLRELGRRSGRDKSPGIRALGFDPIPTRGYDRASVRVALIHFKLAHPPPDALVISRDLDGQHPMERQASLEAGAQEIIEEGVCLCMAIQAPMRETWLLNGFVPKTRAQQATFRRERQAIGFDPCCQAEKLTVADETSRYSAERALRALTEGNAEREEACWRETDWQILRERGTATGLKTFLDGVKDRLVQLVTGAPPR